MSQRAKYLDIAASILARIRNLPPGSRCPGVHQITSEYHVARATAERVLRHLAAQGYVQQLPGRGTFVAEHLVRRIAILPCAAEASAPQAVAHQGELSQRIVNVLRQAGHEVHVVPATKEPGQAAAAAATLSPQLLVTVGAVGHLLIEDLARLARPIVCVEDVPLNQPVDIVATATIRSSYTVTRAVLDAGLTDAWYIGEEHGRRDTPVMSLTHSIGFRTACRDVGVCDISARVRMARSSSDLDAVIRRFFLQAVRRRAVVAANASIGSRFLAAARSCGLGVPENLAIVATSSRGPADVSCLTPNVHGLAKAAGELIQRRIRHPDLPAQDVRVRPVFIDAGTLPTAAEQALRSTFPRTQDAQPT